MAGLGADVTPHVLKHTCATLMLQNRVSTWDVAGVLGTGRAKFFKDWVLRDDLPTGLKFVTAPGRVGTSVTLQER
jgi:hypothetical protein